jgi:hypothetical protein
MPDGMVGIRLRLSEKPFDLLDVSAPHIDSFVERCDPSFSIHRICDVAGIAMDMNELRGRQAFSDESQARAWRGTRYPLGGPHEQSSIPVMRVLVTPNRFGDGEFSPVELLDPCTRVTPDVGRESFLIRRSQQPWVMAAKTNHVL